MQQPGEGNDSCPHVTSGGNSEVHTQVKIRVSKLDWGFLPLVKATVETFFCLVLLIGQSDVLDVFCLQEQL